VLGAVLGILFCKLMKLSYRKGFIDRESYVAQYLALALFTIGIVSTLGSDDLLAAFAAGTAISWDGHFNDLTENEVFSSVIDLLLNCACIVYIGAWLPFDQYNRPDLGITPWRLVILFIIILLIRRIPPLLLLFKWVPEIVNWREALFSGHFGPMGVGAVFVSTLAATRLPTPHNPPGNQAELLAATIQTLVSFVVLGSIIVHGLSIPFFSFGKNMRTRTLSVTRTWTSRQNTIPDWLLSARRSFLESPRPTFISMDPEQGQEMRVRETETPPDGHIVSHTASFQSARVEPTPHGHGVSSAFARPGMTREGSVTVRTNQIHLDYEPAVLREPGPDYKPELNPESGLRTPRSVRFDQSGDSFDQNLTSVLHTTEGMNGSQSGAVTPDKVHSVEVREEVVMADEEPAYYNTETAQGEHEHPTVQQAVRTVHFPDPQ